MDFLLNPNLAYLILVSGFLLTVFAILTPGTGLFELGALFALVVAGWQVYNIPINYWALVVLILGVIPFLLAVRKSQQMVYLGLSALALVVGSAFLFRGEVWWQPAVHPVLAVVVSVLTGGFFWLIVRKALEAEATTPSHDLGKVVGATGEAKTVIHHEGSVQILGELWTARSEKRIKEGAIVRVIAREGFILDVEEIKDN
jgi:membrane-bound serine protease (ClpP class)